MIFVTYNATTGALVSVTNTPPAADPAVWTPRCRPMSST